MKTLSLAGSWIALETAKPFILPGSANENKTGTPLQEPDTMSREAVRCLRQRYDYTGELTLMREFDVPRDFEGKNLTLFLERVNIASELWIDDVKIDRQIISLSTPHTYNLTGRLSAGKHKIAIRINNTNLLNIDTMASGYSNDTQGIWLGIIGRIELQCREIFHISNMQLFPKKDSVGVKLTLNSDCTAPNDRRKVMLSLALTAPDGSALPAVEHEITLNTRRQIIHLEHHVDGNISYWSEFNPLLYTMTATLTHGDTKDTYSQRFGMRTIAVVNKQICINDRPISLRGTLDCGIYPLTGYPPTDVLTWKNTMLTLKEYGMNHLRFHAWCPPEAAFAAADEVGIYISAEMPLWLNHDVCSLDTGEDPIHKSYFLNEAINISRAYGNHPSFIMFSNGNELLGDFEMLEEITTAIKALDNRRLYTLTSNFEHALAPCEDYLCAVAASGKRVRVQVFHDTVAESTCLTYDEPINETPVPVISFEAGQYCMFPDVDRTQDYTGNLVPSNLNVIKKHLIENNLYRKLSRYTKASGMMAARYYKEEMEAMERTHNMGGIELLGLSDYTGQCTATVGLLDVFWKNKGIVSADTFRQSCDTIVPLMKAKRVFTPEDTFTASLDLYDYSEFPDTPIEYTLQIYNQETLIKEFTTAENTISCPLNFITEPTCLRIVLSAKGHQNIWNIFVYPKSEPDTAFTLLDGTEGLDEAVENGGNIIVNATAENLKNPIPGIFKPTFWSPAFFTSDRPCGLWCDSKHPVFEKFPTDDFADFQWKHPIDNSVNADISSLPEEFDVLLEPIPNFYACVPRSPLFEARIGNANVLFNGFDLNIKTPTIEALKNSIFNYASSDKFRPTHKLSLQQFKELFK